MVKLGRKNRHHIKEIPLAPILDLLTVVIFFLILSSSFDEFSKTLIPSQKEVTSNQSASALDTKKVNPELRITYNNNQYKIILKWKGANENQLTKDLILANDLNYKEELNNTTFLLAKQFREKFKNEDDIQLKFSGKIKYQDVLSVVDGAALVFKNVSLSMPLGE